MAMMPTDLVRKQNANRCNFVANISLVLMRKQPSNAWLKEEAAEWRLAREVLEESARGIAGHKTALRNCEPHFAHKGDQAF